MSKLFVALLLVFSLAGIAQTNEAKEPTNLSPTQFLHLVSTYTVPVLVHLKADWCVVCKKESPLLAEFQTKHQNEVVVLEIDLDRNPLLGEHFEIDALPVHLIYYKNELVWNKIGKLDFNQLEEVLQVLLKQSQKNKH